MAYLKVLTRLNKPTRKLLLYSELKCQNYIPCVYKSTHAIGINTTVEQKSSDNSNSPKDPLDLSFTDAKAAFKSKTTWEILRAYIVYTLCSSQYLVENNMKVS